MTSRSTPSTRRSRPGLGLLVALGLEALFFFWLTVSGRVPHGHDGFQVFSLQYWFLNGIATSGEIPEWIPFMTHGTIGSLWYSLQGNLLTYALPLAGSALPASGFLPIFYAGVFLEHVLLGLGVWLLCRRMSLAPASRLFALLGVLGSSLWLTQPWFNLRMFAALPLVLWLLHRYLDTSRHRYLFLGMNLYVLQLLGSLPYFAPVTSLFVASWFAAWLLRRPGAFRETWQALRIRWRPLVLCLVVNAALAGAVFHLTTTGMDELARYNYGRDEGSSQTLSDFLSYAGRMSPFHWAEAGLGVSPALDYGLFLGLLAVPLVVIGLAESRRLDVFHLPMVMLFWCLFGTGSITAILAFYVWPLMDYYRHLALVAPMVKLLFWLIAASGFESVFVRGLYRAPLDRSRSWIFGGSIGLLAAHLLFMSIATTRFDWLETWAKWLLFTSREYPSLMRLSLQLDQVWLAFRMQATVGFAALLLLLWTWRAWAPPRRRLLTTLAIVLVGFSTYVYKAQEAGRRSVPIDPLQLTTTRFQPLPWMERRQLEPVVTLRNSLTGEFHEMVMLYWTSHAYSFEDLAGSGYRTDHWLEPLDRLMRGFWGQRLGDHSVSPLGLEELAGFEFPEDPIALEVAGVDRPKVRLFRTAMRLPDEEIAQRLCSTGATSDVLYLSEHPLPATVSPTPPGRSGEKTQEQSEPWQDRPAPAGGPLVHGAPAPDIDVSVLEFSANRVVLQLAEPAPEPLWLFYSDVWHSDWSARVRSAGEARSAPVERAQLAYKAVRLEPGERTVLFEFALPGFQPLGRLMAVVCAVWLGLLLSACARIVVQTEAPRAASAHSELPASSGPGRS